MRPRLFADADLRGPIVKGVRRANPSVAFDVAIRALERLPDPEVLRFAADRGCVLVSHDRRTMAAAFYEFILERHSPGLILIRQNCPLRQAIEELLICYHLLTVEEFANRIQYIPL